MKKPEVNIPINLYYARHEGAREKTTRQFEINIEGSDDII